MPKGVINPKGKLILNETNRDMIRPYYGDMDSDVIKPTAKQNKEKTQKPYQGIQSKKEINSIVCETRRIFRKTKKKKSAILILLKDIFNFSQVEAENIFHKSLKGNMTQSKEVKRKKK